MKEHTNILDQGFHTDLNEYLDDKEYTRNLKIRKSKFFKGVVAGLVASAIVAPNLEFNNDSAESETPESTYIINGLVESADEPTRVPRIFENDIAQNSADYLGIKASDYFIASDEVMDNISDRSDWWENSELLPIFPPSVYQYKDLFEEAGREHNVSPNFLAAISFIETSGVNNLRSGADAHGVMQFVPRYHVDRFKDLGFLPDDASYEDYVNARDNDQDRYQMYVDSFNTPHNSIMASGDFFSELFDQARQEIPQVDPNHPLIYARVAGAYNGGPSRLTGSLENLPDETAEYIVAMQRLILDIAVANEVSKTDEDVYQAVSSITQNFAGYNYLLRRFKINESLDYSNRKSTLERVVQHIKEQNNDTEIEEGLAEYGLGQVKIRDYVQPSPGAIDPDNKLDNIPPGGLTVNQLRAEQTPFVNPTG